VLEAKLPIAHLAISTHRAGDEGPASPLTAADARIQCVQMRCELHVTCELPGGRLFEYGCDKGV